MSILDLIDANDKKNNIELKNKTEFEQYFTSKSIAAFMSSLFENPRTFNDIRVLDPGAGIGTLAFSFINNLYKDLEENNIDLTLVEKDENLVEYLKSSLENLNDNRIKKKVIANDFVEWAATLINDRNSLFDINEQALFTHAIMNPPYKKIQSNSKTKSLLRSVDIEATNLYSAFVALAIKLIENEGEIVAIIPRSFCNGPYFRSFRKLLIREASIEHIHLFESRDKSFKKDDVLQENVIIKLKKGEQNSNVCVTTSTDGYFNDLETNSYPIEKIVDPKDKEMFIHIPTSDENTLMETFPSIHYSLEELGLEVSTGPVVSFRVKEHLQDKLENHTVPMLYPNHFTIEGLEYPKEMKKKFNAIAVNEHTERWLFPTGNYVVVRRRSFKEDKQRIVASVLTDDSFKEDKVGLDNGLNVFHSKKQGISRHLAYGLSAYLNFSEVDKYFRAFNGNTQVNATDLRSMKYPSHGILIRLGHWIDEHKINSTQPILEEKIKELLSNGV